MISLPELAIMGAASYRATQLGVHDTILDPARDRLAIWHANKPASKARQFVIDLTSCIYCLGWWLSGAILTTYLLATGRFDDTPLLVHGVEWFAVAGVQALANRWDDSRSTT